MTIEMQNIIRRIARQTIQVELEALEALLPSLDENLESFAEVVYQSTGRLVVSGIGKSAIIAQKIVATLNSTGTPALFMHAGDAIHGDLGMIQPEDAVLLLSKSGNTQELKVLLPVLKNRSNPVAVMTADRNSFLAQHADFVLYTPVPREADPNNLAPTASTIAQMALGDALAMALLSLRGFTPEAFAQLHPGGILGKQLYMRVRQVYPAHQLPVVSPSTPIPQTILEMTAKRLGCTIVEDELGRLVGIITDGDIRRMLEKYDDHDFHRLTAADVMTPNPKTIPADELAVTALNMMRQHSITQLIAVEDGAHKGIIHLHDLLREGIV